MNPKRTIFDLYDEIETSEPSEEKSTTEKPEKRRTIFDLNENNEADREILAKTQMPEDKSLLARGKKALEYIHKKHMDYGKTLLKGGIEGISRAGRIVSPIPTFEPEEALYERQREVLDRLLPTEGEDFGQRVARKFAQEAPSAMLFGGGTSILPRAVAASFIGQGAKDLGAPEWAQTALELTTYLGPDLTKKLLAAGKNKDIIEAARKIGIDDEALTPLLQSDFKQKWLAKLTPKRGATQRALEKSKQALGNAYQNIRQSPEAQGAIDPATGRKLFQDFYQELFNMPAGVRGKIQQDFKDLVSRPITGETLINFYQDINATLGKDAKQLSRLKGPIKDALHSINPQLGKDFETANQLWGKYEKIASKLKPTLVDDIVRAGEILGLGGSVFRALATGSMGGLYGIATEQATRKLAQQMLINPRLQQLGLKTAQALNERKFLAVSKIVNHMADEIEKELPEMAKELKALKPEDYKRLFSESEED